MKNNLGDSAPLGGHFVISGQISRTDLLFYFIFFWENYSDLDTFLRCSSPVAVNVLTWGVLACSPAAAERV